MNELPELLQTLRAQGNTLIQQALRLLLLTGVRTGELRYATPEQFDLDRGLWSIPPENVKSLQRKMRHPEDLPPYLVPLATQAVAILQELLALSQPGQRYLLSHQSDPGRCISHNTINGALHRIGYAGRLTAHGIRGTLSTALNEIGNLSSMAVVPDSCC
jgi:integrase